MKEYSTACYHHDIYSISSCYAMQGKLITRPEWSVSIKHASYVQLRILRDLGSPPCLLTFTQASASVASMVVTALPVPFHSWDVCD